MVMCLGGVRDRRQVMGGRGACVGTRQSSALPRDEIDELASMARSRCRTQAERACSVDVSAVEQHGEVSVNVAGGIEIRTPCWQSIPRVLGRSILP